MIGFSILMATSCSEKRKVFDSKMMIKICIILLAGLKIGIVVVFILKLT